MKNVTLSADEELIEEARNKARSENTTLNNRFREWLEDYTVDNDASEEQLKRMFDTLPKFKTGGPFTRDQMNER